jgi:hypothetical protein
MRLVLLGEQIEPALAEALVAHGFEIDRAPPPRPQGDAAVAELAAAIRGAEAALQPDPPACALVAGSGDVALAAALAAVKLGIPCAWIEPPEAGDAGRLVGRVVDLSVDATGDAAELARAVAGIATPTLTGP